MTAHPVPPPSGETTAPRVPPSNGASGASGGTTGPGTAVPLVVFLRRLVLCCILPLVLLACWLAWHSVADDRKQQDQEASRLAGLFAVSVDQFLDARIRALKMLASSPSLDRPGQWSALYQEAHGFHDNFGSHVVMVEAGDKMVMRLNTRLPFGAPMPLVPLPRGRSATLLAMASGKPEVGDLFVGPVAGHPLVAIAVPVVRRGKVTYVMLATFDAAAFQRRLDQVPLPQGWSLSLLDSSGEPIAQRGKPDGTGSPHREVVHSQVAGWQVTLEIPGSEYRRPVVTAVLTLAGGILAATLVALFTGAIGARRLSIAVDELTGAAAGGPRIREIDAARRKLDDAESAQRESGERFRSLFQQAPLPLCLVTADGLIRDRNALFEEVLGYSENELRTVDDWWQLAYPDPEYRERMRANWMAALTSGPADPGQGTRECRITCRDGSERVMLISSIVLSVGVLVSFFDISLQRKAEAGQRLWAELFEQADFALALTDLRHNRFIAVNHAFAAERGYRPEELAGHPLMTVFPPDRREEMLAALAVVDGTGHGVFESEQIAKDGRRFPVLLDVTVSRPLDDSPPSRIVYAMDLSERKRAEQLTRQEQAEERDRHIRARLAALNQMEDAIAARAGAERVLTSLRESEILLKAMGRAAHIGGWDLDPATRKVHWTEEVAEIFDLDGPAEPVGTFGLAFFREEARQKGEEALREALTAGAPFDLEAEIESATGATKWVRTICEPSVEGGKVVKLYGSIQDITERKEGQAALLRSEERFSQAFAANAAAIAITRLEDGLVIDVNDTWVELLGYRRDEVVGRISRAMGMWPNEDDPRRFVQQLKETGTLQGWVQEFHNKYGGIFTVRLSARLLYMHGERIVLSTLIDITDLKEAEREIRALNTELERRVEERTAELVAANKELDSFAYAVSHDLRAPLRAMIGFSQALIEDYGKDLRGEAGDYLEQITLASQQMGKLIDGMLALSRSTRYELRRESVDLTTLALHIRTNLERAEPERKVAWDIEEGLRAEGDDRMLEVVLQNLLGNAWKYTSRTEEPRIRFYAEERDGRRFFCISDNGAGFDMAHASRLFQPFQRLHRQDEFTGIGIGLATVQRIVVRHGGEIEASGEPGKGATFRFTLPSP
ncbi:PAS domain S-box protein [Geomonas sp. Red32]|uniref:PAS domain S-box protein n=1 Tax=Geomonas sp. Red32 TaxID=2912856 RepID=UPI00202D07F4|nr:PAS domain S-box protein [Geomonas sp. Red32]MCM0084254.1 PAS domain S-box protein [Geomonas sp. Red32]